jgi:DNA adenine methylase
MGSNFRFLIWVGAKQRVMDKLKVFFPTKIETNYFEPFLGSASVYFYLMQNRIISNNSKCYLSDINTFLIATYLGVQKNISEVLLYLDKHIRNHSKEYFYKLMDERFITLPEIAAQFIYLNRSTYGGCYRENANGGLSLTFRTEYPIWIDEMSMHIASAFLQRADIVFCNYEQILSRVKKGDFVYLDPPYNTFNNSDKKSLYNSGGFGEYQQIKLKEFCVELDKIGAYFCQSNSLDDFIWELYDDFQINQFPVKYRPTKNCKNVELKYEAVITNYKPFNMQLMSDIQNSQPLSI